MVAPDTNSYMPYMLLRTILDSFAPQTDMETKLNRSCFLLENVFDAVRLFKGSQFVSQSLARVVQAKFAELRQA